MLLIVPTKISQFLICFMVIVSHLHSGTDLSVLDMFYQFLLFVHLNPLKTAPLWCCLIHFIWDSCPMKHWNEDSSIVILSYTFYMGFLSNETLEWRELHCDAVLYILYGIIVQWNTGAVFIPVFHWTRIQYKMYKTASQWSCLHSSVSLDKNPI
jgi:hypothetical protein